jgi:hypothetical protein
MVRFDAARRNPTARGAVSDPPATVAPMGTVTSLQDFRDRKDPSSAAVQRLDRAVQRLDPLVGTKGSLTPVIERELLAIARAVSAGRPLLAASRAERLAGLLEHPAASG